MEGILKECVKNAGGKLRLKDALNLVQAHEGCSREPAYRKINRIVNRGYGMLRWDRPSARKAYITYHPECDPKGTWTPPGPSTGERLPTKHDPKPPTTEDKPIDIFALLCEADEKKGKA